MLRSMSMSMPVRSALWCTLPRCYSTQVSNSLLQDLPKRWEGIPEKEQDSIVNQLTERQKQPWASLSEQEKKAMWYVSYGNWGPRRPVLQKGDSTYILSGTIIGLLASVGIFVGIRYLAKDDPRTMTKEWQIKSDEYLKSKNANPWGGYSQVQSK